MRSQDRLETFPQSSALTGRVRDECHLGEGVVDDVGAEGLALGLVGIEERIGRPSAQDGSQLPGEIRGVLQAEVQTLPSKRREEVSRVPGQEKTLLAVPGGDERGVPIAGDPEASVKSVVSS